MSNNKEILVSVIMPIYNAEKFLRETLDTVVNQTLKDIEIICVDDGSSDGTLAILQEYAKNDERMVIIEQANQYAGVARNNGLAQATGEYVIFWDADDLFELEALEKMYSRIVEDNADICVCGANQLDNSTQELIIRGIYLIKEYLPAKRPFAKEDMPQYIFCFANNVPWNKLYRREFVQENKLQFLDIRQAEDTYFVIMAMFFAQKITYVDEKLITYRSFNVSSLTGQASDANMCACEAYETTRLALLEQREFMENAELQRSFGNRAIQGFLHSLFSQSDVNAYTQIYQFLATKGFADFGLVDKDDAYFINDFYYRRIQSILTMQPHEFLLDNLKETRNNSGKLRSRISLKNKRINEIKERVQEQKDKLQEQKERIREQKERIIAQKETIKAQQAILDSLAVRTALKTKKVLTLNGKLGKK